MRGATHSTELSRFFDAAITMDPPKRPARTAGILVAGSAAGRRRRSAGNVRAACRRRSGNGWASCTWHSVGGAGRRCRPGSIRRHARRGDDLDRLAERATAAWERARAAITAQPSPNEASTAVFEALVAQSRSFPGAQPARRASAFPRGLPRSGSTARSTWRTCSSTKVTCCSSVRPRIPSSHRTSADGSRRPSSTWPACCGRSRTPPRERSRSGRRRLRATMTGWPPGPNGGLLAPRTPCSRHTDGRRRARHSCRKRTDATIALLRLMLFDRAFSEISRTAVALPEWLETAAAAALALVEP